jgi:hypothetical protein
MAEGSVSCEYEPLKLISLIVLLVGVIMVFEYICAEYLI